MTLPAAVSLTHLDAASDDPAQARPQIKAIGDAANEISAHLAGSPITSVPLAIGGGLESDGTNLRVAHNFLTKTATYQAVAADRGKVVDFTTSAALTFEAVATLGAGWFIDVRNSGTGTVILSPDSTELIDGALNIFLLPGEGCRVVCNGSLLRTIGRPDGKLNVAFSAFPNASTTMTAGAFVKMGFGTEDYDIGGYYNTGLARFQPFIAGLYRVTLLASLTAITVGKFFAVSIHKNGVNEKQNIAYAGATGEIYCQITMDIALNGAADYVEPFGYNGDTSDQTLVTTAVKGHFSAHRIGPSS